MLLGEYKLLYIYIKIHKFCRFCYPKSILMRFTGNVPNFIA